MNFFINNSNINYGVLHTGTFHNLEHKAIKNINDAKEYYFNRVARVKNENTFVSMSNLAYHSFSNSNHYEQKR